MKIIIDECVPRVVKIGLPTYSIYTVQEIGWSGITNGKLLSLAASEFDVFITSDKNLRYQQNLSSFDIAIILLPSNQVPVVEALLPEVDKVLANISGRMFITL